MGIAAGDVADVLPNREAATLEAWLKAHPGAAVICGTGPAINAEGARAGAPDAVQVAGRWHFWHNLADYPGKTVARHRGCLAEAIPADEPGDDTPAAASPGMPSSQTPVAPGILVQRVPPAGHAALALPELASPGRTPRAA